MMKIARLIPLAGVVALLVPLAVPRAAAPTERSARPNVVVIYADGVIKRLAGLTAEY